MSDEQENVDAGSETSGDQAAAEPSQEAAAAQTSDASTEQSEESPADAGGAADETAGNETPGTPDANESRTGFADKGLRPGDECKCPDGRKGTVHSFDAGFVCIPNGDQG